MIVHPQRFSFNQGSMKVDAVQVKGPSLLVQFLGYQMIGQPSHHLHKGPPPSLALALIQPYDRPSAQKAGQGRVHFMNILPQRTQQPAHRQHFQQAFDVRPAKRTLGLLRHDFQ